MLDEAQGELQAAIAAIQEIDDYEDFFKSVTFEQIADAASGRPLIYLMATPRGGLALIVDGGRVEAVWLAFSELHLNSILFTANPTDRRYLQGSAGGDWQSLVITLDWALPVLGQRIMQPLASTLRERFAADQAITLIPIGQLSLLPLHAAPLEDGRPFGEVIQVRYAPSAQSLAVATQRCANGLLPTLALADPRGPTTRRALFTDWLAAQATQLLGAEPPLVYEQATTAALEEALSVGTPAHLLFGCHGIFESQTPLDSGLALADGRLQLRRLLGDLRLDGVDLVTLCACQTAMSDFGTMSDEVIGLPAAFLQAGARRVVGTLWSVHVLPTVLLLRRFYTELAAGVDAAEALPSAVQWLRTISPGEAKAGWQELSAYLPPDISAVDSFGLEALVHVEPYPFASPIYWAAFTYTGA